MSLGAPEIDFCEEINNLFFFGHFKFVMWLYFLAAKSLKRELWERLCNGRGNVGTRCSRGAVVELSCGIQYVSSQ